MNASVKNFNTAKKLYKYIKIRFEELELGQWDVLKRSFLMEDLLKKLKQLQLHVSRVNVEELANLTDEDGRVKYGADVIGQIKHNLRVYKEQGYYLESRVMAVKYFDMIKENIDGYIRNLRLPSSQVFEAGGLKALKKRFLQKVLSPSRIRDFESELKQIGKGKLPEVTFQRLFQNVVYQASLPSKKKKPEEYAAEVGHPEAWERSKKWYDNLHKSFKKPGAGHGWRVKESLNEFKRGGDVKSSLGLGMNLPVIARYRDGNSAHEYVEVPAGFMGLEQDIEGTLRSESYHTGRALDHNYWIEWVEWVEEEIDAELLEKIEEWVDLHLDKLEIINYK